MYKSTLRDLITTLIDEGQLIRADVLKDPMKPPTCKMDELGKILGSCGLPTTAKRKEELVKVIYDGYKIRCLGSSASK